MDMWMRRVMEWREERKRMAWEGHVCVVCGGLCAATSVSIVASPACTPCIGRCHRLVNHARAHLGINTGSWPSILEGVADAQFSPALVADGTLVHLT
jgi:hypothetical protein